MHRKDMTSSVLELLSSMLDKAESKLQEKSPLQISAEEYFDEATTSPTSSVSSSCKTDISEKTCNTLKM